MLALSVCSSIYISLCLFVWIRGLIFFFYEKDLTRINLASAIPVKRHSFIYSFIHSSLRISLMENANPETQKKNQKRAKCPRKKIKKQKLSNVW